MAKYPVGDKQFEDTLVKSVTGSRKAGWSITRTEGWCFHVPPDSPVVPKTGMSARFYGEGIGYPVRGLFLDGRKVFYGTEPEDEEKQEIDLYGADAADWLKRWDDGKSVFSIDMGGLGPGYEQAIQITVAEVLRHMLAHRYDGKAWTGSEDWERDREEIEKAIFANAIVTGLGLSGAQFGAALGLAVWLYKFGPRVLLTDEKAKDRRIQVSRMFPTVPPPTIPAAPRRKKS